MNILVTGGAGYIGSVLTEQLVGEGHNVIVVDSLYRGHRAAVVPEAAFVQIDLSDRNALDEVFRNHTIEAVMHLAADTSVGLSMVEPERFFQNNIVCGINLLDCMLKYKVSSIVFSSSAAVYGQPEEIPITETTPAKPVNPYGETKLMFERILYWYGRAHGISSVSLRYFNVAGASERFGSDHNPETLLIPIVVRFAVSRQGVLSLYGDDYDTIDGTCIRDYIHVADIARAHALALKRFNGDVITKAYNLGNGEGYSVMNVIEVARRISGAPIPVEVRPRRAGDPAKLIASYELAKAELGWEPRFSTLDNIVKSAWEWQKEHPRGYEG